MHFTSDSVLFYLLAAWFLFAVACSLFVRFRPEQRNRPWATRLAIVSYGAFAGIIVLQMFLDPKGPPTLPFILLCLAAIAFIGYSNLKIAKVCSKCYAAIPPVGFLKAAKFCAKCGAPTDYQS